ncbi:MAG TPA: plastocyanin/azurin family copper-binding protein [Blastocatellia bacterium]|nr:plastocyanin/azurin family copper-binding protein [Blastocatellia bacterium]
MAQTWIIAIDKVDNAPQGQPQAAYDPPSQTVTAGDIIYWRNNDDIPHWPAPNAQSETAWMDYQIPGKLQGQPAPTSQQAVSFSAAGTYNYVCALHPDETGTIVAQ